MRIAYFDDAGTSSEEQEPFAVVGGVLIHGDREWRAIEADMKHIIEQQVPQSLQANFYFHATHLFSDHGSFKQLITPEQRFQILRESLALSLNSGYR